MRVRLFEFLAPFYPDEQEPLRVRTFAAREYPKTRVVSTTTRAVYHDSDLTRLHDFTKHALAGASCSALSCLRHAAVCRSLRRFVQGCGPRFDNRRAALMMLPYLGSVGFLAALNAAIWALNRPGLL